MTDDRNRTIAELMTGTMTAEEVTAEEVRPGDVIATPDGRREVQGAVSANNRRLFTYWFEHDRPVTRRAGEAVTVWRR